MPASAYDDVVVDRDAERFCDVDDRLGHLDVGLRGRGIAGGVVVEKAIIWPIALSARSFRQMPAIAGDVNRAGCLAAMAVTYWSGFIRFQVER